MISVYCDGGARGNPGPAAYGFVVKQNGQTVKADGAPIGIATNNTAEYTAIIKALTWLADNCAGKDLNFYLDSMLAASQLSGTFKVKNANIREMIVKIRELETQFGNISYRHIPREQNTEADRLVNEALDGT